MPPRTKTPIDAEQDGETPWTMPVPIAGKLYYQAGKNKSYELAKSGVIPTIRTGNRGMLALPRLIEKKLAGES
jgi:hypothetical protein